MQVILLDKVDNLGNLGDLVTVKPGYGRNYLIPSGKAVPATEENRKEFEARRAELERAAAEALAAARERAARLEGLEVRITCKVGEEGKLFGSIGAADIADAIVTQGVEVERSEVRLPEGSLRHTGNHAVSLHLHPEVDVELTVEIVPED